MIDYTDAEARRAEIARKMREIHGAGLAAVFLPCFYRARPPHIFVYPDRVRVLVKEEPVLRAAFQPYHLAERGYREVEKGVFSLVYRFQPGRDFQLELEGVLMEKELPGDALAEEMRALDEHLGFFDLVPLLRLEKVGGVVTGGTRLRIKKLDPGIEPPSYAHAGDAGLDIRSAEDVLLQPGERALVGTGFSMALPEGYAAFVQPRSGLAAKHGISIVNTPGLIDCHYRGEVKVILVNLGEEPFQVRRGDRIAQMVIQKVEEVRVEVVEELEDTARGSGGFGSTGL